MPGLVAWYTGASFNAVTHQWTDISGNGNHATTSGSSDDIFAVPSNSSMLNGQTYVHGSTLSRVYFPSDAVLPADYTLFHVARYDGPSQKRILTGGSAPNANWLSGFWAGISGVAYNDAQGGWLTDVPGSRHGSAWVISASTASRYRSQGVERTTNVQNGATGPAVAIGINMFINVHGDGEASDWAMAAMLVYRGGLGDDQIMAVEDWLSSMYGVALERQRLGEGHDWPDVLASYAPTHAPAHRAQPAPTLKMTWLPLACMQDACSTLPMQAQPCALHAAPRSAQAGFHMSFKHCAWSAQSACVTRL